MATWTCLINRYVLQEVLVELKHTKYVLTSFIPSADSVQYCMTICQAILASFTCNVHHNFFIMTLHLEILVQFSFQYIYFFFNSKNAAILAELLGHDLYRYIMILPIILLLIHADGCIHLVIDWAHIDDILHKKGIMTND